jgi:hypothetical protein
MFFISCLTLSVTLPMRNRDRRDGRYISRSDKPQRNGDLNQIFNPDAATARMARRLHND